MKLKEIISQSDWQNVAIAIVTEHPCQRKDLDGFRIVYETLLLMEPTESEYRIQIERRADMLDSEYSYPDVFGIKEGDEISYSLVFTPRSISRPFSFTPHTQQPAPLSGPVRCAGKPYLVISTHQMHCSALQSLLIGWDILFSPPLTRNQRG